MTNPQLITLVLLITAIVIIIIIMITIARAIAKEILPTYIRKITPSENDYLKEYEGNTLYEKQQQYMVWNDISNEEYWRPVLPEDIGKEGLIFRVWSWDDDDDESEIKRNAVLEYLYGNKFTLRIKSKTRRSYHYCEVRTINKNEYKGVSDIKHGTHWSHCPPYNENKLVNKLIE